jgi:hypothetical protein
MLITGNFTIHGDDWEKIFLSFWARMLMGICLS